jgi:hypothetical protein
MIRAPISRSQFEETNRQLLIGEGGLCEADLSAWQRGRDWLAREVGETSEGPVRRRSPRLHLAFSAHLGGVGPAVTDDIGFGGMRLVSDNLPRLRTGDDVTVRVNLAGRSIYVLDRVVWTDRDRVGMALLAAPPADERALQAAVCAGLLHCWGE